MDFKEHIYNSYDEKIAFKLIEALNNPRTHALILNSDKISDEQFISLFPHVKKHPFVKHAFLYDKEEYDFGKSYLHIGGAIYISDASSLVVASILNANKYDYVLDMCAAPGGKSFFAAERMENTGSVTSCDIYEHKLKRIRDGAARLGLPNIRTELQDASVCREEWKDSADVVLCDVPCSGLGIIRKKPEIRFKNPDEIAGLPEIQARILANCAQYVKKGGTLVYSTCTILQRENEDVVRAFLTENPEFEAVSWTHPVCGERADGMVTLLPPVHNTDGFFIAKMHRKV